MSTTYQEMKSQYEALKKSLSYLDETYEDLNSVISCGNISKIAFLGCGSSYDIAQSMAQITRTYLQKEACAYPAGDLMLHMERYLPALKGALVVAISRSGSTSELLMTVRKIKKVGSIKVLSIACTEESELSKLSDFTLEMPWAFDESVCQTRTVTCFYAVGLALLAKLGGKKEIIDEINEVVDLGPGYFDRCEKMLRQVAALPWKDVVVLADAELEGIAGEGALAFKEICQIPSNYYHILDVRHGPIVLIRSRTLVIVALSDGNTYEKELVNDILKKGAHVVAFCDRDTELPDEVMKVEFGRDLDHAVRGIPFILICQLLSYYKAVENGTNPDSPDGLDPWIKL